MTKSQRYYEAHITVEAGDDWERFAALARASDWRASKFEVDEVDDMSGKWFLSARSEEFYAIISSMRQTVVALNANGYNVLRFKVEDTVLDSKLGDVL